MLRSSEMQIAKKQQEIRGRWLAIARRLAAGPWIVAFLLLQQCVSPASCFAGEPNTAASSPPGTAINADTATYDSHPSAAVDGAGTTWIAWHAYRNGRDQILARRIDANHAPGERYTISAEGTALGPPAVVCATNKVWILWSARVDGQWTVMARAFTAGSWQPAVAVSPAATNAIHPTGATTNDGQLIVAWSGYESGRFRIHAHMWEGSSWQPVASVSSGAFDAWRPSIAVTPGGNMWIVWDEYNGEHYTVQGRVVLPTLGEIETVSPPGEHCLNPATLATESGLYVAWLRKEDVIGGPGVISQFHTLHAAVRNTAGWTPILDASGNSVAAELTHGLMAKIDPKPIPTGGYLGRRTEPMLIEVDSSVWLLWERKSDHEGTTWRVTGDLLGRRVNGNRWDDTVTLHRGRVDYHVIEHARSEASQFTVLASELPRQTRRIYHCVTCDVRDAGEFQQDHWTGWKPINLPRTEEVPPRREIRAQNKTYKLFWADMHCHSGLTADAEGEADELMLYARDRARLDVVVFTNNDFIYDVPLTQYEFELGNFFANVYTRADFLALPSYEWTSRVPGAADALVSDPGNWTPPYQNKSYPNHRSVVYPPSGGPLVHYPEHGNDIASLNSAVAQAGGVTLTQHDAFQISGHPVEVAMELTSGWRRYIARRPALFHDSLNAGHRLGFVACGDTHRRAPGLSGALTGIYVEELTAEAILDALRARRCFATSGSRIFVDSKANGSPMGSKVTVSDGKAGLTLHAIGTRPIHAVTLVRDGTELKSFPGNGRRELAASYDESDLSPGTHWYYWRVEQTPSTPDLPGNLNPAFGHLAWTSPHWITVE